jgi:glutathione synthase/RimK-type ligase-like ATP-grasp enzyme
MEEFESMTEIKVGLHTDIERTFPLLLRRYEYILKHNGIPVERLYLGDADFLDRCRSVNYFVSCFSQFDAINQMINSVLPVIESVYGIPCYPNLQTRWHYDDKVKQAYLLASRNFPMVKSWVFWDLHTVLEWVQKVTFPVVFKLKGGAGSSNVVLVRTQDHALSLAKRMFSYDGIPTGRIPVGGNIARNKGSRLLYKIKRLYAQRSGNITSYAHNLCRSIHHDYALFQEFLPGNTCDVRVNIIGNRAFAFRRMVRKNDFRASGSGMIDYDINKIDHRCLEIAFSVSDFFGFQSMAYDFVYDREGQPKIVEISYTYVDTAVQACPGFFDRSLQWHEGHFWPQYCQLQDLLEMDDLVQPGEEVMSI